MTRLQLMKVHALLAAFVLPAAVLFMTTGALYTWGIKGSYSNEVYDVQLSQPIQQDISTLTALAETELKKLKLTKPSGTPKIKTISGHFFLEWTGSSKDLILEPTENELVAELTVKNTSGYRHFVQLHKAKGGTVFKVYAAIFALALGILLISGFVMAWQTPKLKRITLFTALMGAASFIVVVLLS